MLNQGVFRAFIAIDLPEDLKVTLNSFVNTLGATIAAEVKWVLLKKLHVTLKFLGNISAAQQKNLTLSIETALHEIKPFELNFSEITLFPSVTKPQAIVLRLCPLAALYKLAKILDEQALAVGVSAENREYDPHLTLGRIYDDVPEIPKITLPELRFVVNEITLFRSDFLNYTAL